jgi:hypothetical protein
MPKGPGKEVWARKRAGVGARRLRSRSECPESSEGAPRAWAPAFDDSAQRRQTDAVRWCRRGASVETPGRGGEAGAQIAVLSARAGNRCPVRDARSARSERGSRPPGSGPGCSWTSQSLISSPRGVELEILDVERDEPGAAARRRPRAAAATRSRRPAEASKCPPTHHRGHGAGESHGGSE